MNKKARERTIEAYLRHYHTYRVGISNCKRQLDFIMPSMVARYEVDEKGTSFYIQNNTEKVAIDRIESQRALYLHESIKRYELIVESIDFAMKELSEQEQRFVILRYFECKPMLMVKEGLGYAEEKSVYRLRRHVLDKLEISLKNLIE